MTFESTNPFRSERIPEAEFEIDFVRASGPGGQKVNKTSSKAQVRWNLERSSSFTDEEKLRLRHALESRLTKKGELVVSSAKERSQARNREQAIATLRTIVSEALATDPERVPTKPTRASKRRRLEEKRRHSERKQTRKKDFQHE